MSFHALLSFSRLAAPPGCRRGRFRWVVPLVLLLGVVDQAYTAAKEGDALRNPLTAVSVLQKAITCEQPSVRLQELLQQLSAETQVPLRAAPELAQEPVTVRVVEVPAHRLLFEMGALWQATWEPEPAGRPGWLLVCPDTVRAARKAEDEAGRRRVLEELHADIRRRGQLATRPVAELLHEIKEYETVLAEERASQGSRSSPRLLDLQRRGPDVAALRQAADPQGRFLLLLAAALTPEHWSRLGKGEVLRFSALREPVSDPLPPAAAALLQSAPPGPAAPGLGLLPPRTGAGVGNSQAGAFRAWREARNHRVALRLDQEWRNGVAIAELTLTPSLVAATGVGRTIPAPSLRLHYTDRVRPAPRMGGVPDSRLARRALFDPAGSAPLEYPQLLLQMAQAYGLNLISHGYPSRQNPSTARTTREVTLNETLTRWVRPRSDWAWQEDLLVIHRHHWNRIREEELPRAIYDVWLPRLRASQGLAGEEVGQFLLAVTEQQIPALRAVLQADRTLPAGLERTLPHRDAWRAWALLTDRHRAALLQGQAARWQELPPAVQQHLREGLARRRRERMEPGLPEVAGTLVLVQAATKGLEGQPARWTLVVRREPHPDVAFDLAIPLPKTP